MKIEFNESRHILDETAMGHKIVFYPRDDADTISATANTNGFTPLTAIIRHFDWDRELIRRAARECNSRNEVAIVAEVSPTLLLVPKTWGEDDLCAKFLTKDLIDAANKLGSKVLHFTHFGFTQGRYPAQEIESVLTEMGHYSNAPYVSYPEVRRYRRLSSEDKELWRIKLEKELKRSRRETTLQKLCGITIFGGGTLLQMYS